MFGTPSLQENLGYNFMSDDNASKWKGQFLHALQEVQLQVHPSLSAKDDALEYIENLILNLLSSLCASQPHTKQDVEDRVHKNFPDPIDKWAIKEAQNAIKKGNRNSPLVLPVDKIHQLLVREVLGYKIDFQVTVYIVAVLEYIAADILKLTGNYVRNIKHKEITSQDIKVAICADQVLMDMFSQEEEVSMPELEEPIRLESLTYEEIVKDFIFEETQYMRDLNMIIKVFRAPFVKHFPTSKDLDVIFSNILDIYEFTANLLSSVEEQVELAAENAKPEVGICFQDMAEAEEFSVYEKYVDDMLAPHGKERLNILLKRDDLSKTLEVEGHGFKDAMKFVLPKLLLGPIYHCLHYFEVIKALMTASSSEEDEDCFKQADGLLMALKTMLERKFSGNMPKKKPWETSLRLHGRTGRQAIVQKMTELQKSIDGWEGKDIWQSCSEFILDGVLNKFSTRSKTTERYVFLFDGLIVLCKQNIRRSSVTGVQPEFRLKEKFQIRKMEVVDREDSDDCKHGFELQARDSPSHCVLLMAKTAEEKSNWMAALISLQTRSMLERRLDSILREEDLMQPLQLPPPQIYRFGEKDSESNIVMEDKVKRHNPTESPLIKGGTLLKLIERLTYHMYAEPKFVRTFLTTYRSFCSPHELLDLLVERFTIPESHINQTESKDNEDVKIQSRNDMLKRFRKEYVKPVQFRVVNVLRHWVDHHYYDFERDITLIHKLKEFLDNVKGKAMKKMAESIIKVIHRRFESMSTERELTLQKQPPPVEWHITKKREEFHLMTLHPIEIARQITLLEFDLYRAVQPSELVGCAWMKQTKHKNAPNLLKMISFTNNFTFSLEKCIIESENLEERVAVVHRIIEILLIFQELNNFNGVLEVVSAINSAPVYRLEKTFEAVPNRLMNAFEEARQLNSDHGKKYMEKLRSINPPCVPFLGMYLTNILKIEEGNLDFLPNRPPGLINFSKRRKVAEITGEIQQYQNQPYCLSIQPEIREYFESLNPREELSEKEFNDYLYEKSLDIEPRNCTRPPKFARKTEFPLKSPGIRPITAKHLTQKHASFPFNATFGSMREDAADIEASSPHNTTPSTPTTPLSPPHNGDNVFLPVTIGQGIDHSTNPSQNNEFPENELPMDGLIQPPPLPPRRKNRDGEDGSPRIDNAPEIPPRGLPPPVPPRKDSMFGSLTRCQSVSQQQPTRHLSGHFQNLNATLPRCSAMERDRPTIPINFNGEEDITLTTTPKLPPKTYKHIRQQSS
ncbi:son of sevenless homolog 2-like [Mytilus trossulus]|uniref:son of sevenless homolog 2-like n=1 Tax=Mytilus trossulus TaxID=6551 RepID=UPI00300525DB